MLGARRPCDIGTSLAISIEARAENVCGGQVLVDECDGKRAV